MFFRHKAVVQDHGVILVRDHQLLVPRHGAEGHKAVGHGWGAEFLLAQRQQTLCKAAPDAGHGTANHVGVGIFVHHANKAVPHIQADLLQPFYILLMVDVADQV